jgi:large subunit ribosomal protein L7/L12
VKITPRETPDVPGYPGAMFTRKSDQERIDELTSRVIELEEAVKALSRHTGMPLPSRQPDEVSATVRTLAAEGKPIAAIKQLRQETGLGLAKAKEIVDRL